jgi:VWFA-related protein
MYSRETVVDVIVTDSKGQPIQGLKQTDFTIKEDGKPQPLRSFGEFSSGTTTSTSLHRRLPTGVHTNFQPSLTNGPVNILLIDALHSDVAGIVRTLQATSAYLNRMPQGTQMAIFWLGPGGLHLLQGFTSDSTQLMEALPTHRTDIGSNQDTHATDWYTIDALNQIAEYVAGIKGRKNLLWFTSGMPVHLTRDGGYGWGGSSLRNPSFRAGRSAPTASESAMAAMLAARYSNSQYNPAGSDSIPSFLNSNSNFDNGWNLQNVFSEDGDNGGPNMGQVHRLMDTYERFTAEQIAVSPIDPGGVGGMGRSLGTDQLAAAEVAEQSGGFATFNSNDLSSHVAEAIDKGSHYYTLSYVPPRRKPDGHYHKINVALNIPGAHLVYREGYNAEDPKPIPHYAGPALIQASLNGKTPAATQLLFDAKFVPSPPSVVIPASRQGAGHAKRAPYDLVVAVPQSQISFSDNPDGTYVASLRFAFEAYDLNGKHLGGHSQDVKLALTPDRYKEFVKNPVIFHEQLALFPGPLSLRIGVLDTQSSKVGTLEIPITVPKK